MTNTRRSNDALADALKPFIESFAPIYTINAPQRVVPLSLLEEAAAALREPEITVTDEMAKRMVVYEGHSPENAYAVKLAREKLEHTLAAVPKEGL